MNGGAITDNAANNGGGVYGSQLGILTINAGQISDNIANFDGGGVDAEAGITMNGGKISGNKAGAGGGIYGSIAMKGGTISDNTAEYIGGGLYISADFSIEGGTIENNKAKTTDGLYVESEGSITGGTITDKIEKWNGCYSITYDPNKGTGNTAIQFYDGSLSDKVALLKNKFARNGFSFADWNTKEDGSGNSYDKEAGRDTGDIVLYAQWIPKSFTVKFNANGGSGTMTSQTRKKNDNKELPENTFSYAGYIFKGWNTKADGSGTFYPDKTNENIEILNKKTITLYAQWEAKTDIPYRVEHYKQKLDGTYNKKASETESFTGTTGTSVTPEVKTYKGFSSPVTKSVKIKGNGTTVVKYYYERNSYTLTWDFAGGTAEGTYTSGSVKYGEAITAPVPTREGYTFNGWKTAVPEKMPAKNLTIKALWTANISKVTVEHYRQKVDGSYPTAANDTEVIEGKVNSKVTPSVKTYKGFTAPATKTVKIKADGSVVVKYNYTRNSYKLTWDFAGGKASGSYTKGTVIYGAKITAPVPVRDGYAFTGWDKTVPAKMPAKDATYKAKWRKLTNEEQVRNFVSRFYTIILDRPAEESGLNDWTNRLIGKTATGADVAAGFINSGEFQNKKMTDEEYVTKLYRAFFDREPDKAGYDGWLRELKNGKSRDDVLRGFINSPEFNNLCKKYGINAGSY